MIVLTESLDIKKLGVRPLCLPFDMPEVPEKLTFVGMQTETDADVMTPYRKVEITTISTNRCAEMWKNAMMGKGERNRYKPITSSHVCTFDDERQPELDSRKGDSGMPLIKNEGGKKTLYAFVLYGSPYHNLPSVNLYIYFYLDWMQETAAKYITNAVTTK
jgi:hypothetical protein